MKKIVLLFIHLMLASWVFAQDKLITNEELSGRRFIENKGQFNGRTGKPEPVLFAVDHGGVQIYFTKNGVSYGLFRTEKNYKRKKGQKGVPRLIVETDMVHVNWQNANPKVKVTGEDVLPGFHSYPVRNGDKGFRDVNYIKGYKKISYKNIYEGIDLEYTFHPKTGLKYAFIVHPGADPNQISINVETNRKVNLDQEGNIRIHTKFGDIVDHKPLTFYDGNPSTIIESAYQNQGNTIQFKLGNYDKSKKLVIDPWTVVPSNFFNSNKIWEIETDQNSNVYVYGGDSPMRLRKYNAAGVFQWEYNTPWDTANYWVGTLKTDLAGNSYITSGTSGTIRKINTNMGFEWNAANNGPIPEIEFWNLSFNCDYTKLYCGGMRAANGINIGSYRGTVFELSMANGVIVDYVDVGFNTGGFIPSIKEVRSVVHSPNQNIYYLTLDSIGCVNNTLTQQYQNSSGFNFTYGIPAYGVTNQGIHAITANTDFIYTNNGNTLQKRNIANGAVIATVNIPGGNSATVPIVGGNTPGNSGIVLDSCDNVYVGSTNGVYKYDANLNPLGSFTTPAAVYDVAINYNGEVVACGNNFIISNGTLAPCHPPLNVCLNCLEITPAGPFCASDGPTVLTSNNPGGVWSGPGITNAATGAFNPAIAGVGTHVIHYTLTPALTCGSDSIVIQVNDCSALSVCLDTGGNFAVSGGTGPYNWQSQTSGQDCSACFLGCVFPPGCAVNTLVWTTFSTGTSIAPPAAYPIQVVDNLGTVYTINNAGEVLPCSAPCPTIAVTVSNQTNVPCTGGNTGSATVSASGGTGPYTYTWQPGNLTGATQNALGAGTYNVTATDANNCPGTIQVTIGTLNAPVITLEEQNNVSCFDANDGSAEIAISGGTAPYSIAWSPSGGSGLIASGLAPGAYTASVTDNNNCTASLNVIITQPTAVTLSLTTSTPADCGLNNGTAQVQGSGGTGALSYTWQPGNLSGATQNAIGVGVYTVTATDQNNCTATLQVIINAANGPVVNLVNQTNVSCPGGNDGSAEVSVTGGSAPYTYAWSPSGGTGAAASGLSAGVYTLTVTDDADCPGSISVTITEPEPLLLNLSSVPADCGFANGSAQASVSGGTGVYQYSWSPAGGNTPIATGLNTGTYSLTVTDASSCTATESIEVGVIVNDSTLSVEIQVIPESCAGNDGTAQLTVTGGQAPYTFAWPIGVSADSSFAQGLTGGTYIVTVGDQCYSIPVEIVIEKEFEIPSQDIPNIFTPNNDDINDIYTVNDQFESTLDFYAIIYNRWGLPMHKTEDKAINWNPEPGTSTGVYFIVITYKDCNGKDEKISSTITLSR